MGEYTRFLARSIVDAEPGLEVVVLAESGVGESYSDGVIPVIPSFTKGSVESIADAVNTLRSLGGADILHVQHEYGIFGKSRDLVDLLVKARDLGAFKHLVVTLHTVYHPFTGPDEASFQEAVIDEADAVIVHSPLQEFELISQYGAYPGNLHRIPHGTMLNPYYSEPRRFLAGELGLNWDTLHGRIIFTVPGFLRRDKGLDVLVNALELLQEKSIVVIVAGEVKDNALEDISGEGGASDNLILIPRYLSSREILMLAAISDAIVLPYRDPPGKYAVSGILHLSMGSMKPVIGTNVPRLSELYTLTPRLVARSGDPYSLADLLSRLASREYLDLIIPYAGSLYSYAVRTSWARTGRRHVSLYRRLLAGK